MHDALLMKSTSTIARWERGFARRHVRKSGRLARGGLASLAVFVMVLTGFASSAGAVESELAVPSPLDGNGHNVSFDGRLFIVRTGPGWMARILRPERITVTGGVPDVSSAFSPPMNIQLPEHEENALAICEPSAADAPYACDAGGARSAGGAFDCYDVWIIDSDAVTPGQNQLRRRRLFLQVRNARTPDATVERFEWRTGHEQLATTLRGIEPTVTRDGRFMIYQGDTRNGGEIDRLVYTYNATPCGQTGWSAPRNITEMHTDARLTGVYRLADSPLRTADGTVHRGEFHGAYPWLFADGEAIIFTATPMPCRGPEDPGGCGPRRNGLSVIGYPTNWALSHIDGPVNPSTADEVRLFFSSPGPRTFAEIPISDGADVWPFFGTNTSNYTELRFDDGLDGRYALLLHMNELVTGDGNFDFGRTPDVSGHFHTGVLRGGASFPERNNGALGKAIELDGTTGRVEVRHATSLNPVNQLTVELMVRPRSEVDCDGGNNYRYLLGKGDFDTGAYTLVIEDNRGLMARVRAGGVVHAIRSNREIPVGSFSHVAFTFEAASGEFAFFIDGEETNREVFAPGLLDGSTDPVLIGGAWDTPACPPVGHGSFHGTVDEVKISNVVRYGDVIPPPVELDAGMPPPGDAGTPPPGDGGTPPPIGDSGSPPREDGGGVPPMGDAGTTPPPTGGMGGCNAAGTTGGAAAWLVFGVFGGAFLSWRKYARTR
jgi:hypothetical protein